MRLVCVLGVAMIGCGETDPTVTPSLDAPTEELASAYDPLPPDVGAWVGRVFCKKRDHGTVCEARCNAKGIPCVYSAYHPMKSNVPNGLLYGCNKLLPFGHMCSYAYQNGDSCHFRVGRRPLYVCAYTGID